MGTYYAFHIDWALMNWQRAKQNSIRRAESTEFINKITFVSAQCEATVLVPSMIIIIAVVFCSFELCPNVGDALHAYAYKYPAIKMTVRLRAADFTQLTVRSSNLELYFVDAKTKEKLHFHSTQVEFLFAINRNG